MTQQPTTSRNIIDAPPLSKTTDGLVNGIQRHYVHTLGVHHDGFASHYKYQALAYTIRDYLMENWQATKAATHLKGGKRAYYLSLEFLMGRALGNAILNIGLDDHTTEALNELGISFEELIDE
ncbi:MAG: hypothetical protein V3R68_08645 [Gammaproteobacteria bacterium]